MSQPCEQEDNIRSIKALIESVDKRINGSVESYREHIRQGTRWRIAIIGMVAAGIFQVVSFAYLFGSLASTVKTNNNILEKVVELKLKG